MAPARLQKVDKEEDKIDWLMNTLEAWVNTHAPLCLFILFSFLVALFVVLIFTLTGVSATESGTVYNQFNNIV